MNGPGRVVVPRGQAVEGAGAAGVGGGRGGWGGGGPSPGVVAAVAGDAAGARPRSCRTRSWTTSPPWTISVSRVISSAVSSGRGAAAGLVSRSRWARKLATLLAYSWLAWYGTVAARLS